MSFSKSFIAIFFLLAVFTYFQKYPLKYGIKAGWNYSNVNAVDEDGESSGYLSDVIDEAYAGFVLEKQISKTSYLQAAPTVSYTESVTFVELPIYYKYNFYRKFSFIIGPKLNYIPDEQYNNFYYFRRRFGISGDIGLNYRVSNHFILEGSFSKGFTKQFDQLILTYYQAKRDVYRVGIIYFF
ncbi:PorT family protein [Chryseobacterium sp. SN22]|uniref:outer membrane beta-barrel protein n=1 Tax=Chryseobacterium sp. SN22 TaxID=2606431 RepID=UPI0011EC4232|nr:outer membrane beta-barrel protein [Chryseobacterium sp. SN22]KAA0130403.1 PorT family protein [Chryseobacterium sp. SN22]